MHKIIDKPFQISIHPNSFIHSCIENITRLIPDSVGTFYLVDDMLTPRQHLLIGISRKTHQSYLHNFLTLDPLHPRNYNHQPATFVTLTNDSLKTPYYHQFMKPNAMRDMCEIFVRRQRRIVAALSLMRDTPFSPRECIRLRATLPLLEVATAELLPGQPSPLLTPKEAQIVEMVREGTCNKRIASHLDVSLSTVKTHLRNIFSKAQVSNRTELVRYITTSHYGRLR